MSSSGPLCPLLGTNHRELIRELIAARRGAERVGGRRPPGLSPQIPPRTLDRSK